MTQEMVSSLVNGHTLSLAAPCTKIQYICRLQSTVRLLRKRGEKDVIYVAKANVPHFRNSRRMGASLGCSDVWDSFWWASVIYDWSMVLKATINQS